MDAKPKQKLNPANLCYNTSPYLQANIGKEQRDPAPDQTRKCRGRRPGIKATRIRKKRSKKWRKTSARGWRRRDEATETAAAAARRGNGQRARGVRPALAGYACSEVMPAASTVSWSSSTASAPQRALESGVCVMCSSSSREGSVAMCSVAERHQKGFRLD